MFYSQFILAKKGPLGTIWIAAHLERKLRKNQVADTDIGVSVDSILSPEVPIALRLSSHLLLGVVRIYSRKVNYLFHDCSEALLKVKQAFRSTAVDLPPEESTAPYHSITLPETFDLDDFELPDSDNFQGNFVDHHVSAREQITLQDSMDGVLYSTSQFGLDERFGDGDTSQGLDLDEELFLDKVTAAGHSAVLLDLDMDMDNVDPQASGLLPMTPFMDMDIDDDDDQTMTGEDRIVAVAQGANMNSIFQEEKIVDHPAPLCDSPSQSLHFDGHGFPIKDMGTSSTDPSSELAHCAPYTPRLVEEVVPTNSHFDEDHVHGPENEILQSNSQEVVVQDYTNNLQYESEYRDKKLVAQDIVGNFPSEQNQDRNEAGNCSLLDNKSSETDVSHMPQDTQEKREGGSPAVVDMNSVSFDVGHTVSSPTSVHVSHMPQDTQEKQEGGSPAVVDMNSVSFDVGHTVSLPTSVHVPHMPQDNTQEKQEGGSPAVVDMNSVPFDVGHTVSSPTSVLTEQLKLTSASCVLDSASALTDIRERAETSQIGDIGNGDRSSSDVGHIHTEGLAAPDITVDTTPASTSVEISNKPFPSSESVSAICKPINDCLTVFEGTSQSGCVSHKEASGSEALAEVGPGGHLPEHRAPYGIDPTLRSVAAQKFNQDESRSFLGSEITDVQHLVRPNKESFEHRHVLRPCSSFSSPPDTVISVDRDLVLNAPHVLSTQAEQCPLTVLGSVEPVHVSGIPAVVQGEDCQSSSIRDAVLQANRRFESVPSNGLPVDLCNLDTFISKDSQSGNLYGPASSHFAVPEPERLLSAPTAVPFAPRDLLVQWNFENKFPTEHEASGNGFNTLSGRKRHLMESAPVQQDGGSAKFSEMRSRRTVNFIPADEDILSSILVGRNSSVLKLKPTPPQSGIESKKRPRVTPRTSVAKRKVLLDDTMVLHGDTIRQQLTSTEDIRRIRKKAPCTRPEIWIIQKHLLEDGIFSESLFTGMSPDLAAVHNRTYDATDFRVSEMDVGHTLSDVPDKVLLSKSTDLNEEPNAEGTGMSSDPVTLHNRTYDVTDFGASEMDVDHPLPEVPDKVLLSQSTDLNVEPNAEGTGEPAVVGNGGGVDEPMETHIRFENRLSEDHLIYPVEPDTQEETRPVTDVFPFDLQKSQWDITAAVAVDRDSGDADMMGHADTVVNEPPFVTGIVSEDRCNETVGSEIESLPVDNSRIETVLQNDGNLNLLSVEKDVFIMERSNQRVDDAIRVADVHEEGPCLVDGVPMERDGSFPEISESGSGKVMPQNIRQDHQVDASDGCSSPITAMMNNCLMENRADVLADAFTPLENDKPHFPNIFDGSEGSTNPTVVTNDYAKEGNRSEWGHVFRDENVKDDAGNSASNIMSIEDPQRDLSCPSELNANTETVASDEGKNPGSQEADLERTVGTDNLSGQGANLGGTIDDETTLLDNTSVNLSPDLGLDENDTEFLNFDDDDDEAYEEADNSLPSAEEPGFLDTTGWSSRTRGVARYLQTQFDTESGHGRKILSMDNLLSGKTRKEASRMFFETLVLKTRDYIHVEQEKPFDNINIKPLGKLVKSEF